MFVYIFYPSVYSDHALQHESGPTAMWELLPLNWTVNDLLWACDDLTRWAHFLALRRWKLVRRVPPAAAVSIEQRQIDSQWDRKLINAITARPPRTVRLHFCELHLALVHQFCPQFPFTNFTIRTRRSHWLTHSAIVLQWDEHVGQRTKTLHLCVTSDIKQVQKLPRVMRYTKSVNDKAYSIDGNT